MSKLKVYNRVPITMSYSRKKDVRTHEEHSTFVVVSGDGQSCEIKPWGRGNKPTIQVANFMLDLYLGNGEYVAMNVATLADFMRALTLKA